MGSSLAHRRALLAWLGGLGAVSLTGCSASRSLPRVGSSHQIQPEPLEPPGNEAAISPPPDPLPEVPQAPVAPRPPTLDLPPRALDAEGGSAFLERHEGLGRAAMDAAILEAILAGNVPDHLRRMVPIELSDESGSRAVLHVTCDYLAVGSDHDFVRMPMTSAAAQKIADRVGASLPTPRLVDAIWRQAAVRLPPSWIDGGPTEGTLADYAEHNRRLEELRRRIDQPQGVLVAGHKKDIVLCNKLVERPGHVAIYGWQKKGGENVQPLSTRHSCRYADYSHGVRLVDQMVTIDGESFRLSDVLTDPDLAALLSGEGPLLVTAYPTTLPPHEPSR